MSKHLRVEIDKIKRRILFLGATVQDNFQKSIRAIQNRDEKLARDVINTDLEIDDLEVEIEEECLKILALHQPVARDLRYIVSVLKVNNDLERIGDLAVNIAERATFLSRREKIETPFDLVSMEEGSRSMVSMSLDALIEMDIGLANDVCEADEKVDDLHREAFTRVQEAIVRHPDQIESLIAFLSVSRYLERVADHATNIAEDVIYMLEGEIIRHRGCAYVPETDNPISGDGG
jgi:phosphate transport system protein